MVEILKHKTQERQSREECTQVTKRSDTEEVEEKEEEEDTELRHCFYKGLVNAQAEHAAVISLCSGLVSFYARLDTSCTGRLYDRALLSHRGYSGAVIAYTRLLNQRK